MHMVDVFLQMICLRVIRLQVLLMVLGDNKYVTLSHASCDKLHVTPDIYGFLKVYKVETHFLLENLWISEPSLGILEKFQCSSALPNMKYNCAVLFWSQLYWVFIYDSKYIFS